MQPKTINTALAKQKFLIQLDFSSSVFIIGIPFDPRVATVAREGSRRFAICFHFRLGLAFLWCHLLIQVQVLCRWQRWSKGSKFIPSSFQASSWTSLCPEALSLLALPQVSATSACEASCWLLCIFLQCFCSVLLNPTTYPPHHLLLSKMGKSFQTGSVP